MVNTLSVSTQRRLGNPVLWASVSFVSKIASIRYFGATGLDGRRLAAPFCAWRFEVITIRNSTRACWALVHAHREISPFESTDRSPGEKT